MPQFANENNSEAGPYTSFQPETFLKSTFRYKTCL